MRKHSSNFTTEVYLTARKGFFQISSCHFCYPKG
jgi:hypothetical protein